MRAEGLFGVVGLALTLVGFACAPERASTSASPHDAGAASVAAEPAADPAAAAGTRATVHLRIARDSEAWDALVRATQNPLRWAYHRARRTPALAAGGGVVFLGEELRLARVDLPDGALRWRDADGPATRWPSLVASDELVIASRPEPAAIRALRLADGDALARQASPEIRGAAAIGAALALDEGCSLALVDPRDAATLAGIEGLREPLAEASVCARPARLVAADDVSATLLGWRARQPYLVRVDRTSGAILGELALDPDAELAAVSRDGLVLETRGDGARALRLGAGGVVERRWALRRGEALELREVRRGDGPPPLLLAHVGRRWSALDPGTLADRWTIESDDEVVIVGEVTSFARAGREPSRARSLRVVDPERGRTRVRRRLPVAHGWALVGEVAVVEGPAGVLAVDLEGGATRWALKGQVREVAADGGVVVERRSRSDPRLDVVDPATGRLRLRLRLPASLLTRVPAADGDLSVVLVEGPGAIAAFADDPSGGEVLTDDPIAAFAAPCREAPTTLQDFHGYAACHPPRPRILPMAGGSADLTILAPVLDRLAAEWRAQAERDLDGAARWPILLVLGRRGRAEPEELAAGRAEAVRDALLARGVPCYNVIAVGDPDGVSARVEIVWHDPISCLL